MQIAGAYQYRFSRNPCGQGTIQITDSFWPYRKGDQPQLTEGADAYVAATREMLDARACIQSSFSTADEILVRSWFSRGIPARTHRSGFQSILSEVEAQAVSADYWDYVRDRLRRVEKLWVQNFGNMAPLQELSIAPM